MSQDLNFRRKRRKRPRRNKAGSLFLWILEILIVCMTAVLLVALNIIAELGCVSLVSENGIPAVRVVDYLFAPVSMAGYFFNV